MWLKSSVPKGKKRIAPVSNREAQHLGIVLPFSGSFMRAFGKGHRGLLDGCFLGNESAGLITLAWITD